MQIYRVNTTATGLQGGDWLSTLWFDTAGGTAAQAHAAAVAFWTALAPQVHNLTQMVVTSEVFIVETTTDSIVSVVNVPQAVIAGTNGGTPNPAATQGLLRLLTGAYVGGRQLRGRLYIWGTTTGQMLNGGTTIGYRGALESAANALIGNLSSDWVVYSRKNGTAVRIQSVSAWAEWSVQRSRRD